MTITHPVLQFLRIGASAPSNQFDFDITPKDQKIQKDALNQFAALFNQPAPDIVEAFEQYRQRWLFTLWARQAVVLEAEASTSIAAEISKPSVYENAGLPLHSIYGFFELPESEVKGCARSYAEIVWFAEQYESVADEIEPANHEEFEKAVQAWHTIQQVFGWADENRKRDKWIPNSVLDAIKNRSQEVDRNSEFRPTSSMGSIIFGSGIPKLWTSSGIDDGSPRLQTEILNNHHRDYYNGDGWPGEWESPGPTYFLAAQPKACFQFPLRKRGPEVPESLFELAQQWLAQGLVHTGIGAKTGIGYGFFKDEVKRFQFEVQTDWSVSKQLEEIDDAAFGKREEDPLDELDQKLALEIQALLPGVSIRRLGRRMVLEFTVELLTPAFLAGANQNVADLLDAFGRRGDDNRAFLEELIKLDCKVHGKLFKSRLRKWWRTMHSAFFHHATDLLRIEEGIFGATTTGQRVRVKVVAAKDCTPVRFDFRNHKERPDRDKNIRKTQWNEFDPKKNPDIHIVPETTEKTVQGLFYQAYGMDQEPYELDAKESRVKGGTGYQNCQRFFVPSGAQWQVSITIPLPPLPRDKALELDSGHRSNSCRLHILQVVHSLRLFTLFDGLGARSRKGFGSFKIGNLEAIGADSLERVIADAQTNATDYRNELGLESTNKKQWPESFSIDALATPVTAIFVRKSSARNARDVHPFEALDQLGAHYQSYAKQHQHKRIKIGLGGPRKTKIGTSEVELLPDYVLNSHGVPQHVSEIPESERGSTIPRLGSPLHFRGTPVAGGMQFSVIAFEMHHVPSKAATGWTSRELLKGCVDYLVSQLAPMKEKKKSELAPGLQPAAGTVRRLRAEITDDPQREKREKKGKEVRKYVCLREDGDSTKGRLLTNLWPSERLGELSIGRIIEVEMVPDVDPVEFRILPDSTIE